MKNKKIIYLIGIIISLIILSFSFKDICRYYYIKMGNKNYYSKNYKEAIKYYEKALKIKEDYNVRINIIITDYEMKNYEKVLKSPVKNGFLKGNSLVLLSEKNQNNEEYLKKSLEYYKSEILVNDDINIKKNYEIIEKKLKNQQNQENQNSNNNQQNNKDKNNNEKQNNKDKENNNQDKNNENNQNDNKDNQQNQNNNDNQSQNNSQQDLNKDNNNNEKSQNSNQSNNNSKNKNEKEKENNKNSNSQNSSLNNQQQNKQQKELQAILKNLENSEKQSFKNNERLIGVENKNETKNRW